MPTQRIVKTSLSMAGGMEFPRFMSRESAEGDRLVVKGELDPSGYPIRIEVEYRQGTYRVVQVQITASGDSELTSAALGIPVKEAAEGTLSKLWALVGEEDEPDGAEQERRMEFQRRQRRRWLNDDFLAQVAEVYKRAQADRAESVIKVVADELGPAGYSSAQRWVSEARKRGLLPKVAPGKRKG
jgi:hypothetical protein